MAGAPRRARTLVVLLDRLRRPLAESLTASRRLLADKGRLAILQARDDPRELTVALSEAGFVILKLDEVVPGAQGATSSSAPTGRATRSRSCRCSGAASSSSAASSAGAGSTGRTPTATLKISEAFTGGRPARGPLRRLSGALPRRDRTEASPAAAGPPDRRHHDRAVLPPRGPRSDEPPRPHRPPLLRPVLRGAGGLQLRVQHRQHPALLDELRGRPAAGRPAVPRAWICEQRPRRRPHPLLWTARRLPGRADHRISTRAGTTSSAG